MSKQQESRYGKLFDRTINEINTYMTSMTGFSMNDLIILASSHIKFPMRCGTPEMKAPIEDLDINERARNTLRRRGWNTVGDIAENIESRDDLMKIRGMGILTADIIMRALFVYQFNSLPEKDKEQYVHKMLKLNGITSGSKSGIIV